MKTLFTLLFAALVVFAWGPWVDQKYADVKLKEATQKDATANTASGQCAYKKTLSSYRTAFGRKITAEYDCSAPFTMKRDMFVSSFGTAHPLSKLKPTVETD